MEFSRVFPTPELAAWLVPPIQQRLPRTSAIVTGEMPLADGDTVALRDLLAAAGLHLGKCGTAEERSNSVARFKSEAFERSLEDARKTLWVCHVFCVTDCFMFSGVPSSEDRDHATHR